MYSPGSVAMSSPQQLAAEIAPYIPRSTNKKASHGPVALVRPVLTLREREVLIAWIHDDTKDGVAKRLQISAATVRSLLQRVRAKYAAAGRPAPTKAALVARALQDGLVKIDEL
ncbi:regulatory protein LuxR [Mycolicibacterium rhodesiae JS60]|nr:regulatory protein LuxR [Mycolicibacterium rhodesiae JS60]